MSQIADWMKNYSMVFLLLAVLTSVAARQEYRKYIQIFVEIVLVITLVSPLLGAAGKSQELFDKMSYDSFWQGLEGIRMDQEKADFFKDGYYIDRYEEAIAADVKLLAKNSGYVVTDARVELNESFEVENMELVVAKETTDLIVGTMDEDAEDEAVHALREKISAYYQIESDKIAIKD